MKKADAMKKIGIDLSEKELVFLLALFGADKQTALQLLAAEHAYKPSLVPKLLEAQRVIKAMNNLEGKL
jgi:ABC-type ATPase involved in cell division